MSVKKVAQKRAAKNLKGSISTRSTFSNSNPGSTAGSTLAPTPAAISTLKPATLPANFVAEVAQAAADIANVRSLPGLMTFGPGDKQGLLKPRPGCEKFVQAMAFAALRYPALLGSDVDPAAMSDTLDFLTQIQNLEKEVGMLHKTLADTSFARLSGLWKESLDVYSVLSRKILEYPDLITLLTPMSDFLAQRPAPAAQEPVAVPVPVPATVPVPANPNPATAPSTGAGTNAGTTHDVIVNVNPAAAPALSPAPSSNVDAPSH